MVRDFSQKTVQELYETIRVNVDEEEQWKVFDFVEDFFMEELEIGDYINDINSYHLHMFDKHDVTTKKFDAIVEKAGKVDANYAAQIEGYCSLLGEYGKKFETVCAMLALDLIGVKVFRYSDETAEAVASGEKLLKESGTIYESFADMMSPEDAKRYLDFLENGSREGLTGAELAGVEKADALLVSRKVEYEDVWDLRNAGDLLESGSKTIDDIIDGLPETTNGKGVARNFESTGDFEQTIRDFDALNPIDVKEIQTKYGSGKVGKLSDGTTVVARPGSTTGGATLEIRVSNRKVYKIRY